MTDKLTYSAYWLHDSDYADCYSPDSNDSPGASFLLSVQDRVNEITDEDLKADIYDEQASEWAHEIADSAVPIYTDQMWRTFVDLGAYNEDPSELGAESDDMNACAGVSLFLIAHRLAVALIEERKKELGGDTDTDEEETDVATYQVVRFYRDTEHPDHRKVIETGLSLKEAQDHCNRDDTREDGVWFDGYEEEA